MINRWINVLVVTLSLCMLASLSMANEPVKIGVLAKNGAAKAMAQWKATADYLSEKVPDKAFTIVPLDFKDVNLAVENGSVSFFLVNSSMFVETSVRFGTVAVATMINSRQGKPLKAFGGVILTRSDRDDINTLNDLRGKTFMAVSKSSFGGWQMAYKEILDTGITPAADFASLEFGGKHENVVLAVLNGAVDAGTVRTDTLERMAAEQTVFLDDFKIIAKASHGDFPFVCSTPLYPEWPMARLAGTPVQLGDQVAAALIQLTPDDTAAKDAKVVGWTAPLDYTPVEALQKKLNIGAYAQN